MKVIWTEGAAEDLLSIVDYISQDSVDAARRVAKVIYDNTMSLSSLPYRGRKRRSDEGRELLIVPWPYCVIYQIIDEQVIIAGIQHTARNCSL